MKARPGFKTAAIIFGFAGLLWYVIFMRIAIWGKPYDFGMFKFIPVDAWIPGGIGLILLLMSGIYSRDN